MNDAAAMSSMEDGRPVRRSTLGFPVVGVGASAGGLAATQRFLENLPAAPGMAFVIVLHLSAEHESYAASILQRATTMPVRQVTQSEPIRIDHVYVIAPALHLQMDDSQLIVDVREDPTGRPVAVDRFFRTLGQAHGERAMAIVMSGMGSDGTLGLREVKAEGGICIAQDPDDAEHDSMPSSVISNGLADFVLPAAEIGTKLCELWENARSIHLPHAAELGMKVKQEEGAEAANSEQALLQTMSILATRTGNDFRHYKRGTVLRRLERRMQVTRQVDLPAYRVYLDSHPQETTRLLQDMLISVTSFFRDAPAFDALSRELTRTVGAQQDSGVRAWSVGCATGEEAYSLAMTLHEATGRVPGAPLQIFASDIDDRALGRARLGRYPETISGDVSEERLLRFFDMVDGVYQVKKGLRDQILFARHNVLSDPPFSRLDVIACRNLLIYLERDAQVDVLEAFHFALKPGGLLFLGSAESADALPSHFEPIDKKHRIYRASVVMKPRRDLLPLRVAGQQPITASGPITTVLPAPQPLADMHRRVMQDDVDASLLVDSQGTLLFSGPGAARYLKHVTGEPSRDVLEMVVPALAPALRAALMVCRDRAQRVVTRPVSIADDQGPIVVHMMVRPVSADPGLYLVRFEEADISLGGGEEAEPDDRGALLVLEAEIRTLQARLSGTLGDSAASTEALRASNEELQSMNEELRSASEELVTSKEELQSVNEELATVNFELKRKVEETAKINDDLNNLIASMSMATVFVDRDVHIRGFTPSATQIFNLLPSDAGRPLADLAHRLDYDQLGNDVADVIRTLRLKECELRSRQGEWYLMRISVYRTADDRIDGAVLNFIDISERKAAQEQLRVREERLRVVAESTRDFAVFTIDTVGHVTSWNAGAQAVFGYTADEAIGMSTDRIFTPEDRIAGKPEEELAIARREGRALDERWHLRADGSRFYCSGVTAPLMEGGRLVGYYKIARDLTERQLMERQREELLAGEKELRERLESAAQLRTQFLATMSHELKNPLNLAALSAHSLARSPAVSGNAALRRAVDNILRSISSQGQIIDDLLDLSRLHTGKLTLSRTPLRWMPMVDSICDAIRAECALKQVSLSTAMDDVVIYADAVRAEQIAWNLIGNALKFTPSGGSIHVTLAAENGFGVLRVEDTGRGIDAAALARIFDMFEQAGLAPSERRGSGLGIGLALVRDLTQLQGGTVHAHSDGPGRGSMFTVQLPLYRSESAAQGLLLQGLRVLLIGDEAAATQALGELLEAEGAELVDVLTPEQALRATPAAGFDVLVWDVGRAGTEGFAMLGAFRRLNGGPCRAISLSSSATGVVTEQSRLAGFDAHLGKPLAVADLVDLLRHGRG